MFQSCGVDRGIWCRFIEWVEGIGLIFVLGMFYVFFYYFLIGIVVLFVVLEVSWVDEGWVMAFDGWFVVKIFMEVGVLCQEFVYILIEFVEFEFNIGMQEEAQIVVMVVFIFFQLFYYIILVLDLQVVFN